MATVREVFTRARDRHPAFDPEGVVGPSGALLRELVRLVRHFAAAIADARPDTRVATFEIDPAAHDYVAGEPYPPVMEPPLPPSLRLVGGTAYMRGSGDERWEDVEVVRFPGRERTTAKPYVLDDQGRVTLMGGPAAWSSYDRVVLRYVPVPAEPVNEGSDIDLPGDPTDALAAGLAAFMANRAPAALIDAVQRKEIRDQATVALAAYLDDVTGRNRAVVGVSRGW